MLIKLINNFNLMTKVFAIASIFTVINRLFAIFYILCFNDFVLANKYIYWNAYEYTFVFLIPLAFFAYFCSSKYAENKDRKISMYFCTYVIILIIVFVMCAQIANEFIVYLLKSYNTGEIIDYALKNMPSKLFTAVRAGTLYFPICCVFIFAIPIMDILKDKETLNDFKHLEILNEFGIEKNKFCSDVEICKDFETGEAVVISEEKRMENILIQGASGTGKTSTLLLPMCASDLKYKYKLREETKRLAFEAINSKIAYIDVPYSNEMVDKNFDLSFIKPIKGHEEEYYKKISSVVKINDNGKLTAFNIGITVLEPDGELNDKVIEIANNFELQIYKIDPSDDETYSINPFANSSPSKVASVISTVLKGMYESENPDRNNIFFAEVAQQAVENIAILLKIMYPRLNNGKIPTLNDMLNCLYDYDYVENMCEELKKVDELRDKYDVLIKYFEKNFYLSGKSRRETEKFLYGITTQLDNLLRNRKIRNILCGKKMIDLDCVLENGYVLTVYTRRGLLGSILSKAFGMFFILMMQDAVLRRGGTENTRIPHYMYIDEFADFINKESESCFTMFRKYRCGLTIAIQNLSQLERVKSMEFYRQVVISNCKTVVVFGDTNKEDSKYWNEAFGKEQKWKIGNSFDVKPLFNVNSSDDTGVSSEEINMSIYFDDIIEKWEINELPFRHVFYKTKSKFGETIMGKGITSFVNKEYFDKKDIRHYNLNI